MKFSTTWKASTQPRKQRKYRYNAPLHIRGSFLGVHLSKDLRTKYGTRSVRVRSGDTVKILRGTHKKKQGKVTRVDVKKTKVYIDGIEITKKDGSKAFPPFSPSNLQLVELNTSDKKRMKKLENGKTTPEKN